MVSEYPPSLAVSEEERLVQAIKDWTIAHGLAVRPPPQLTAAAGDDQGILAFPAPVTLFPSPFPEACFEQARSVQTAYNQLYARISQDEEFLGGIVKEVADGDDFIRSLWDVHLRVKKEGYVQPLSLGLFRSDYMVHKETSAAGETMTVKQVEFNTIAASFGGLSAHTSGLHKFLGATEYPLLANGAFSVNLPTNDSTAGLAKGLKDAHTAYGTSELGHPTCVIFLVQDGERNVFDQRHLEYEIQASGIPVFRLPVSQIFTHTTIAESSKRQLVYQLPSNPSRVFEVAVVYLRSAYGPGDYPDAKSWDARYHIERSGAIKCPTVLTQLAGMKKVQQVLALPEVDDSQSALNRFIPEDAGLRDQLRGTFTDIYPMDTTPSGLEARKLATDPEKCLSFVLKPQREGGGNNFYKAAIPAHLKTVPEAHWGSYILMKLITPPPVANVILRNGNVEKGGVICELGMYGACLWNQETRDILRNDGGGYLLRTKGDQSEEGGVAAGFGCMDSANLV
ncbi:glutathione synthetase-like protein [Thozetella sp. PMI_491]|nr:glutathione synthetase-like protein [Thozetella sp. PMI_491]